MIKTYSNYASPNGISFHHSVSLPIDGRHAYYRAESHQDIEVLILLSGTVDYQIDGAIYSLAPGDCVVVNSKELHSLTISPDSPYERYVLQFPQQLLPKLSTYDLSFPFINAKIYKHIIPENIVSQTKMQSIMRKFKILCEDTSRYAEAKFISQIIELAIEINTAVDALLSSKNNLMPSPKSTNELLQSVINYVNTNVTEPINTAELADSIGVSESYLYRFFKDKMSITLHQYINNQKMQLALSLLNQGYTPQVVALHLGYDYYATFFTQFKKVIGRTPSDVANKVPFQKTATPTHIAETFRKAILQHETNKK